MLQHNTVVSGFIGVNDAATSAALSLARIQIGSDEWKKGYSKERCALARNVLKDAGIGVITKITAQFTGFTIAETKDAEGNVYRKVRVTLGKDILSLDIGTEFAERLLPKLGAAASVHGSGVEVTISCFASEVERDGRTFVNHVASVKVGGEEVKAATPHFQIAADAAKKAADALIAAGVKDRKAINAVKASAKEEYFWKLAEKLSGLFPKAEPSDSESKTA